ncbi:MAG: fimbrillin family protein, partial [Alistipes sp.]|nr:fimbrillin family protein [Alistipes sp.]
MKKNLFLGLIALTALTVTGCSKDDVVSESPSINRAIEFGTYVGRDAQSRAHSIVDVATLATDGGFGVFAYYTDDAHYNGTAGSGSMLNFMNNQKVTSTDSGVTWTYSPIKYWPNETNDRLTFFAYAPYDDADGTNNTNGYDNIEFTVTQGDPIINFAVNGTVKSQQDLVWSRTDNKDIIKNPNVDV